MDAEQTTPGSQPKIYDSTTGIIEEGSAGNERPALETDGTGQHLDYSSASFSGDFAFLNVQTLPLGNDTAYGGASTNFGAYKLNSTTLRYRFSNVTSNFTIPADPTDTQYFAFGDRSSNTMTLHYQGVSRGTSSNSGTAIFNQIMAGNGAGQLSLDGRSQELIFYSKSMSSDRTAMMSNVNTYYVIY